MDNAYTTITNCRVCESTHLLPFIHLGSTPLADRFLDDPAQSDQSFPLDIRVCAECHLVQLASSVARELLYGNDYGFYTGASPSTVAYFARFAADMLARFPAQAAFTVEIAGNDGTLLQHFQAVGKRVLNVDPAVPPAQAAIVAGIPTLIQAFDSPAAEDIVRDYGQAGLILANNVVAHVADPVDLVQGVAKLLSPEGVFVFEVQYVPHLLFRTEFDHLYHEHHSFFSLGPIERLCARAGLRVFDVQEQPTQGGSLRVFACHEQASHETTTAVPLLRAQEIALGLDQLRTYEGFAPRAAYIKHELVSLLQDLKRQGKRVAGFGTSAKSCTLLNYFGIGPALLDYVLDATPFKYGKYTPGSHIPIIGREQEASYPDYYLLMVWNYLDDVMVREQDFREKGVRFIVPIPAPLSI